MYISKLLTALNGNSPKYHGIRQQYISISYYFPILLRKLKKITAD